MTNDMTGRPGFESDVKPLFRERDRKAMQSRFDLWSYDDVSRHAEVILDASPRRHHAVRWRLAACAGRPLPTLGRERKAAVNAHRTRLEKARRLGPHPRRAAA